MLDGSYPPALSACVEIKKLTQFATAILLDVVSSRLS